MYKAIRCFIFFFVMLLSGTNSHAQLNLAEWNFPNNPDNNIVDISIPANAAKTIYTVGGTAAVAYGLNTGATTWCAWTTNWDNGNGLKYWETEFITTGYFNIEVSSKQQSSATGPKNFALQYKIGAAGAWAAVPAAPAITVANNWTTGVLSNVLLPVACENQPSVYLRWIMTSNLRVDQAIPGNTVAAAGASRIDDLSIKANDALNHYRSIASGDWATLTTWESSPDLITWSPAQLAPNYYSKTITVRAPHLVSITKDVRIDETTINVNGTVNYNSKLLTINEGAGVDLQVNGNFTDGSATSAAWIAGATWALGASGTYTKTENTNALNWQNNYSGGISTIPATANWVLNKTPSSVTAPILTTTNMYYPNLTIMNTSFSAWSTVLASTFSGNSATATIKGNLDIGGPLAPGFGTVDFLDTNTFATPVQVLGNMTIRSGCNVRNHGTGFEIYGNMLVDGSASYIAAAPAAKKYKFSGGAAQIISGASSLASFKVYQLEVTKSANTLTLSRPVKVDNNLNLVNGIVINSAANLLTIESGGTATNTSNASFVRGPVSKLGPQAFTFPVGKNSSYRPIGMGISSGGSGSTFWTETFSNSCANGCAATGYAGPNGAWTVTDASPALDACGFATSPNTWYISGAECGNAVGACGSVCGAADPSLHVSSTTIGDLGAAYDAGGWCAFGLGGFGDGTPTDKRAESPAINCTGFSTITLAFNYIENGSGTIDDATLWYFDGTVWAQLSNPAKTATGCGGQGIWTAYSITLPATANNNPNVKIGFRWVNDDDGVGSDPSFAVDDITLSIAAPVEQFTAEYFYINPQGPYGNVRDLTLDHISQCEYWTLAKVTGAVSRSVTLSWNATSCGVTLLPDLRIARWRTAGTIWNDLGNGSTTGNTTAGTITTAAADNLFGPYTLGSFTSENPLPVELLNFEARYTGKNVELKWATASEKNNDFFEVERRSRNTDFESIMKVKGAGTTNALTEYLEYDEQPITGISYYRLKQTDYDGAFSWSKTVPVNINSSIPGIVFLSSQPGNDQLILQLTNADGMTAQIEIVNILGEVVLKKEFVLNESRINLNTITLNRGIYFLRMFTCDFTATEKFAY